MTIEETHLVDAVGVTAAGGEVVLLVADHLEWGDKFQHLQTLREKLNRYLAFIESGELIEKFPEASGRAIRIDIKYRVEPPDDVFPILEAWRANAQKAGVTLRWGTVGRPIPAEANDSGERP